MTKNTDDVIDNLEICSLLEENIGKSDLTENETSNIKVCSDVEINDSKLSEACDDLDATEVVGNKSDCNLDTDDSIFEATSVDVVIDRVRAVTLRAPITIEGKVFHAVIDTGAEVTVLSRGVFNKIPEGKRPDIYPAKRNLVVAEAGKKMQTLGMADVSLEIGPLQFIWSVYIAPIGDEILLGCDIIDEKEITINTKKGLEIQGKWINCDVTRKMDKIARVVLKESVTIPSNSEVILPAYSVNSEILDTRYGSIEPIVEDGRNILVARCLVDPYQSTIPVRIVNMKKHPVRIKKNYLLGEVHPVVKFEEFGDEDSSRSGQFCSDCINLGHVIRPSEHVDSPHLPDSWNCMKVSGNDTGNSGIEAEIISLNYIRKLVKDFVTRNIK